MSDNPWLDWTVELQSLAQAGLFYGRDDFDLERYERIRTIAAEMMAALSDLPIATVRGLFCNETGYQTPKLDTRAAIFDGDRILLVRENDGRWSLPGGWCDVNLSISENTVKEAKEEAGLDVRAERLIALHDGGRRNHPRSAYGVTKAFVECTALGGAFTPNSETTDARYFALDELPELSVGKNTEGQIRLCLEAHRSPTWIPPFD